MGLFDSNRDATSQKLLGEITGLRKQIADLIGQRDSLKEETKLQGTIKQLRAEVEKLTIESERIEEEQERKEREVRHEVGLLRKQVTAEQEIAVNAAKLEVREENLQADRDRFENQMKFTTERFEREVNYLREIAGQLMERLPLIAVNSKFNGHAAVDDGEPTSASA